MQRLSFQELRRVLSVTVLGTLYVSLFWFHPPSDWPSWMGSSRAALIGFFHRLTGLPNNWSWVISSLIFGALIPSLVLVIVAQRREKQNQADAATAISSWPTFLGIGHKIGWLYVLLGYIIAFGFLLWLAARPSFRAYYAPLLKQGLGNMSLRFALVLIAEHIAIQGLILRLALPDLTSWPVVLDIDPRATGLGPRLRRFLHLGPDWSLASFGLSPAIIVALLAQAWVFGWVHMSKDLGELLLSFPGGLAMGYLAWRAQSIWPCFVLHAATGLSVIAMGLWLGS